MINPSLALQTPLVEKWQLGEGQQVDIISEAGVHYTLETGLVVGGLLMMSVQRDRSGAAEARGLPRSMRDAHIAANNPHEPIIEVGRRIVVPGFNAVTGKRALLSTTPLAIIKPYSQE